MKENIRIIIELLTELGWKWSVDKGTLSFIFRQENVYIYHDITGQLQVESESYHYPVDDFVELLRYAVVRAYEKVEEFSE